MAAKLITFSITCLFITFLIQSTTAAYNVISYGAKPDGKTDSTHSFLKAWAAICGSAQASTFFIPRGTYLIKAVEFRGPCKNRITFQIDGTLVAPTDYHALGNSKHWVLFRKVDNLAVNGGNLDAKGAGYWNCRKFGQNCPIEARSITFNWGNNIQISGLTSINSLATHLVINGCNNVIVRNVKLVAPDESPNTDGIHVQSSTGVRITDSILQTGDDCISIGPGTRNLLMDNIKCGPGHGISIGSLARSFKEDGVENIKLTNAVFTGSDNGVRIKSWARPSTGFVKNVVFENIVMNNVKNPIIIDQNYCPHRLGCPHQTSGVKIRDVTYRNIRGTSSKQRAVIFDCSSTSPCEGINLQNIKLTYMNKEATSSCKNIEGTTSGVVMPQSCLA